MEAIGSVMRLCMFTAGREVGRGLAGYDLPVHTRFFVQGRLKRIAAGLGTRGLSCRQ